MSAVGHVGSAVDLDGRAIIVTGAGGEIGRAYVEALVGLGARVIAADLPAALDSSRQQFGENADIHYVAADITSEEDWERVVGEAVLSFGALHGLVNNAALYQAPEHKRDILDLGLQAWDDVLRVNVRGVWQGIRAAAAQMSRTGGGSIVNVSSAVARAGATGFAHYVASKAAVEGLTRAAAKELGRRGVRVNAVAPGLVYNTASRTLNTDQRHLDSAVAARSLERPLTPADLVGAVTFLLSPGSGFITGQTLVVDGGGVFV